jgi:endonuclease-8
MDGPQTHVLADRLAAQLCGRAVEQINVPPGRWQANVLLLHCAGQVIQKISARGKWLFFDFSHGVTWACCLLAKSKWDIVAAVPENGRGEEGNGGGRAPLLVVTFRQGPTAVLRGRPLFLTLPTSGLWQHPDLADLGPDPLAAESADVFVELFLARLRPAAGRTLAAALLDQSIVAGVGNPLKCELLFRVGLAPATRVGELYASQLDLVARTLYRMMRLAGGEGATPHVYDRAGEACGRCHQPIAVDRSGADGRWSWHCPNCQKPQRGPTLF